MSERSGTAAVTNFDGKDLLDCSRLEVFIRHRILFRACVADLLEGPLYLSE